MRSVNPTDSYDALWDRELQRVYKAGRDRLKAKFSSGPLAAPEASAFLPMPVPEVTGYEDLHEMGRQLLRNGALGVVHLNGGLATRFGQIKATHEVADFSGRRRTFLELKIGHVRWVCAAYGGEISYGLMNSPMTDPVIRKFLADNKGFGLGERRLFLFVQTVLRRKFPRRADIEKYFSKRQANGELARNLAMVRGKEGEFFQAPDSTQEGLQWAPAGHFDAVAALILTRMILRFIEAGAEFLQFSNIDNLAATVEPVILGMLAKGPEDLIVEVARKRPGDRGGIPVVLNGLGTVLVEEFALPSDFDAARVQQFNTATYWIRITRILKIFGLSCQDVRNLPEETLALRVRQVRQRIPSHTVLKKVDVQGLGGVLLAQDEQLLGDITRLYLEDTGRSATYLLIDTDKRFIPIKTKDDLIKQEAQIRAVLQDRILLN